MPVRRGHLPGHVRAVGIRVRRCAGRPRHAAAYAAIEYLRPSWLEQVAEVCRLPAAGPRGFQAKSKALSELLERDDDGAVQGGPALRVAASLARDILAHGST